MKRGITSVALLLLVCTGCATPRNRVVEAFPPTGAVAPWLLQDEVWSGSFDEAAPALGDDADTWAEHDPARVWLARYCHEQHADQCLTVRCFAFATAETAQQAFAAFRPENAQDFAVGDAGCWMPIGVLFRTGRLVWDVFGPDATWNNELQAALLARCIEKLMPPQAPDDPQ